ncbi:hypothetical protein AVEN_196944-1, partial [Araneus ventricosus]
GGLKCGDPSGANFLRWSHFLFLHSIYVKVKILSSKAEGKTRFQEDTREADELPPLSIPLARGPIGRHRLRKDKNRR